MTQTRASTAGIKGPAPFTLDKHFSRHLLFCKQSTSKVICIVLQSTAIFNAGQVKDQIIFHTEKFGHNQYFNRTSIFTSWNYIS